VTVEAFDLENFAERLRKAGLSPTTAQLLAAHKLLLIYAERGKLLIEDPEALASHLGPIFCGSPDEQHQFREQVLAWRNARTPTGKSEKVAKGRKRNWRLWAGIAAVAIAALAAGEYYRRNWIPDAAPPAAEAPPTDPAADAERPAAPESAFRVGEARLVDSGEVTVGSTRIDDSPWIDILFATSIVFALVLSALWLHHFSRRQSVLKRLEARPDSKRLELDPPPSGATDLPPTILRRVATGLRRRRGAAVFELSVTATVESTAKMGGFVVPVFAPRFASQEYLVLIDRRSAADHSANLVWLWVSQLRVQGVTIECYEFDSDPRVCRAYGSVSSHRLSAILARHHRATVMLCAESDVCIDPMTDRPHRWIESLSALPNRVLLTAAPPYRWAENERSLLDAGFVVLPASPAGLQAAAAMESEWRQPTATALKYTREFPRTLAREPLGALDRNEPPEKSVTRLLRELQSYLGPDGFRWLCACAVYPQMSWSVTLVLLDALKPPDNELDRRRAIEEQLPSLSRLPWFRYGYMPDWLRRVLIASLPEEQDAAIRSLLERLVCELLDDSQASKPAGAGSLQIHIRNALEISRAAPVDSPLQDEVFLDFMSDAAPDPTALRLSSLAGFHGSGVKARGFSKRWRSLRLRYPMWLRAAASLAIALLAGTGLWFQTRGEEKLAAVSDSDISYALQSSDLSASGTSAAIDFTGKFLYLTSPAAGNSIVVWDLDRKEASQVITTSAEVIAFAVSPVTDQIAYLTADDALQVSNRSGTAGGGFVHRNVTGGRLGGSVRFALRFNAGAQRLLLFSSADLEVFDVNTGQSLARLDQPFVGAAFSPVDKDVLVTASPTELAVWDTDTLSKLRSRAVVNVFDASNFDILSFDTAGRFIVTAPGEPVNGISSVDFLDFGSLELRATIRDSQPLHGMVFSGDDSLAAYSQGNGRNRIYDLANQRMVTLRDAEPAATNRLYTVRFIRSQERAPNSVLYEIHARTIDVESPAQQALPADLAVNEPAPSVSPPQPAPGNLPPAQAPITQTNLDPFSLESGTATPAEVAARNASTLESLEPDVRNSAQQLVDAAAKEGITLLLTQGRYLDDEAEVQARADGSNGLHVGGRAFDVAIVDSGRWSRSDQERLSVVGRLGKQLNLVWGGDWTTPVDEHFESPTPAVSTAAQQGPVQEAPVQQGPAQQPAQTTAEPVAPPQTNAEPATPQRFDERINRRRALLIGINDYRVYPDLAYPQRDVQELARVLETRGVVVTQLLNPTRQGMLEALNQAIRQQNPGDQLWFFFSGRIERSSQGSKIVPVDVTPSDLDYNGIGFYELFNQLGRARGESIVFLDGTMEDGLSEIRRASYQPALVITAASGSQVAYESAELQNGIFTSALVAGLRGEADANRNGIVTGIELSQFVDRRVKDASAKLGRLMTPVTFTRGEDIPLTSPAAMRPSAPTLEVR